MTWTPSLERVTPVAAGRCSVVDVSSRGWHRQPHRQDGTDDPPVPGTTTRRASSTPWSRAADRATSTAPTPSCSSSSARSVGARAAGPARVRRRPARAADGRRRDRADAGPAAARERDDVARLTVTPAPHPPRAPARPSPRRASRSSAPPPRWPWPPRARCRATPSTRSSGPSRTPRPASASATTPRARRSSPTPPAGSTRSTSSPQQDDPTPTLSPQTLDDFSDQATEAADLLLADYETTATRSRSSSCAQLHASTAWTPSADLDAVVPAATPEAALLNAAQVRASRSTRPPTSACPDCGADASPRSRRCRRQPAARALTALDRRGDQPGRRRAARHGRHGSPTQPQQRTAARADGRPERPRTRPRRRSRSRPPPSDAATDVADGLLGDRRHRHERTGGAERRPTAAAATATAAHGGKDASRPPVDLDARSPTRSTRS